MDKLIIVYVNLFQPSHHLTHNTAYLMKYSYGLSQVAQQLRHI